VITEFIVVNDDVFFYRFARVLYNNMTFFDLCKTRSIYLNCIGNNDECIFLIFCMFALIIDKKH